MSAVSAGSRASGVGSRCYTRGSRNTRKRASSLYHTHVRATLLLVAIAGCGNVEIKADAGTGDLRTLRQGCVVLEHMDEAQWTGAPNEVADGCGHHRGTV